MAKFLMTDTIYSEPIRTVRLGQPRVGGSTPSAGVQYGYAEIGKAVKLTAESRYELCADGDPIEAVVTSSEYATAGGVTADGFSIGGVVETGYFPVQFTATTAVGAFVVAAAQGAVGVALPNQATLVKPAADQDAAKAAVFKARVVSLGEVGTGAAGTVGLAKFI